MTTKLITFAPRLVRKESTLVQSILSACLQQQTKQTVSGQKQLARTSKILPDPPCCFCQRRCSRITAIRSDWSCRTAINGVKDASRYSSIVHWHPCLCSTQLIVWNDLCIGDISTWVDILAVGYTQKHAQSKCNIFCLSRWSTYKIQESVLESDQHVTHIGNLFGMLTSLAKRLTGPMHKIKMHCKVTFSRQYNPQNLRLQCAKFLATVLPHDTVSKNSKEKTSVTIIFKNTFLIRRHTYQLHWDFLRCKGKHTWPTIS